MYTVMVDDNFHFMDESERWKKGSYATADEAIAACRRMVDEDLARYMARNPGMSADDLYGMYAMFGDDPFIVGQPFSAHEYARQRAEEMCPNAAT
jgi:hypothetical protein